MAEITIDWPSSPLSPKQWTQRLEALALEAESYIGKPCPPQTAARLAVQWLGLSWSGITPATIAASTRASLLVGENVILATGVADQLAEAVHARLDDLWQQAQDAAVVESQAVLMLEAPPSPAKPEAVEAPEAPDGWLTTAETAELLAITNATVGAWRDAGRFGSSGWGKRGTRFRYAPDAVEQLMTDDADDELDQLISQVQQSNNNPQLVAGEW